LETYGHRSLESCNDSETALFFLFRGSRNFDSVVYRLILSDPLQSSFKNSKGIDNVCT
jgi:hypothetical protein